MIVILTSSDCKQEGPNCHYVIKIKNNSAAPVIWGINASGIYGCRISGELLQSGGESEYQPSTFCIENSGMINGEKVHIYFVDPAFYNPEGVYYPCDSVELRNKILRHDSLTLDDLRESDFTVSF